MGVTDYVHSAQCCRWQSPFAPSPGVADRYQSSCVDSDIPTVRHVSQCTAKTLAHLGTVEVRKQELRPNSRTPLNSEGFW